jgi:membrane fusion protein, copper/silver efflux system
VLKGLAAGQQVVASGQFLIDSEASLQGLTARAAAPDSAAASSAPAAAAAAEFDTRGRVVGVDGRSVTLEHDAVPALKWPPMTMPFQLARPDLARDLKAGDAVRFRFRQQGDDHVVTAIERERAAAPHAGHAASAGGRP